MMYVSRARKLRSCRGPCSAIVPSLETSHDSENGNHLDHKNLVMLDLGMYKATSDMGELPNNMGDEGVQYIAQFLRRNKSVKIFSILHNAISLQGLEKIVDALEENDNLTRLCGAC